MQSNKIVNTVHCLNTPEYTGDEYKKKNEELMHVLIFGLNVYLGNSLAK